MTVAEYLVSVLKENNATDVFGIPGGVVLDFLYAIDKEGGITPYLSYHEQAAAFEAIGYAQVNHTLGVAYATRGPGFTNLITGIADAYADSIPVLFITAHIGKAVGHSMRFEKEQELDTVSMVRHITKYADVIEEPIDSWKIQKAIKVAMDGRKGPVVLDFSSDVWSKEIDSGHINPKEEAKEIEEPDLLKIYECIRASKRPIFLVGDGIRQSKTYENIQELIRTAKIPVVSSRGSQDVAGGNEYYYGYIGSHGIRYANMIFDKADLVITIGNRLAFPITSETYKKSIEKKIFIQIEIERSEIKTAVLGLVSFVADLKSVISRLNEFEYNDYSAWNEICQKIKNALKTEDCNKIVAEISEKLKRISLDTIIVCDVGNNEFWTSRAYETTGIKNRILYSKSFGTLGCGLPKAIGASIKTKKPTIAIVGDQGFQLNIQELQLIKQHSLPIEILVINNKSSGMIQDRQKDRYGYEVHTTKESGYQSVDIKGISNAYGFSNSDNALPCITAINVDDYIALTPSIPKGKSMYDMVPMIDSALMEKLKLL